MSGDTSAAIAAATGVNPGGYTVVIANATPRPIVVGCSTTPEGPSIRKLQTHWREAQSEEAARRRRDSAAHDRSASQSGASLDAAAGERKAEDASFEHKLVQSGQETTDASQLLDIFGADGSYKKNDINTQNEQHAEEDAQYKASKEKLKDDSTAADRQLRQEAGSTMNAKINSETQIDRGASSSATSEGLSRQAAAEKDAAIEFGDEYRDTGPGFFVLGPYTSKEVRCFRYSIAGGEGSEFLAQNLVVNADQTAVIVAVRDWRTLALTPMDSKARGSNILTDSVWKLRDTGRDARNDQIPRLIDHGHVELASARLRELAADPSTRGHYRDAIKALGATNLAGTLAGHIRGSAVEQAEWIRVLSGLPAGDAEESRGLPFFRMANLLEGLPAPPALEGPRVAPRKYEIEAVSHGLEFLERDSGERDFERLRALTPVIRQLRVYDCKDKNKVLMWSESHTLRPKGDLANIGLLVAVFDTDRMDQPESTFLCNAYDDQGSAQRLSEFLAGIRDGRAVLVAVGDSAANRSTKQVPEVVKGALEDYLGSDEVRKLGHRESFALVCVKGRGERPVEQHQPENRARACLEFEVAPGA
ncbi:hypothetical protein DFJ74DRAFT_771426 [Hyaloraphidium curvatum]|nr:hypothetical protein DFJ74DRAFT_771426 [Hyaloraphidium curvatum]